MANKTLVLYHYFEKDLIYVENFFHFLRFGYAPSIDYIVIIAGEHTIDLPQFKNLTYLFTKNKNNDYGGYSFALKQTVNIEAYDFFVFINSSVRGPFLPSYISENWTTCFTNLLTENVGLVGSAINILPTSTFLSKSYKEKYGGDEPFSHVESMAYSMSKKILLYLLEKGLYDLVHPLSKDEVIRDYEIRLSQEVLAAGWNIKCLLAEYNTIDYRKPHADLNPTSDKGDPSCSLSYFGRTAHPYETVFVKTNRDLFTEQYLCRLAYSSLLHIPELSGLDKNLSYQKYLEKLKLASTSKERVSFIPPKSKLRFAPKPLRPLMLRVNELLKAT
ncbi:MAG: hypothetical protein Q8O24_04895 [Gallionellaceae bacterium]|nr:hypothetical protein [Gallionellaceae bacterium]